MRSRILVHKQPQFAVSNNHEFAKYSYTVQYSTYGSNTVSQDLIGFFSCLNSLANLLYKSGCELSNYQSEIQTPRSSQSISAIARTANSNLRDVEGSEQPSSAISRSANSHLSDIKGGEQPVFTMSSAANSPSAMSRSTKGQSLYSTLI